MSDPHSATSPRDTPQGDAPPAEWPLFYLTAITFFLLGALVVFIAYQIGNCV